MPFKAKVDANGKKQKFDRNVALENRLLNDFNIPRDVVFSWNREQQSAELERLEGRAARSREVVQDELLAEARENFVPPPPPPAPAAVEAAEAEAAAPLEQVDTKAEHPTAMDIDEQEAVDRLLEAAESPNFNHDWLLQQPMQPPTAGQMSAEAIEMSSQLLNPLDDQTREQLNNMSHEQQVARVQEILAEQWSLLMTPPEQPPAGNSLANIPADLHPVASQLPIHLQSLIAGTDEYAQRMVLGMPEPEMYRQLYRGLRTRISQYNQHREQLRRQIELDPLLSLNPYVSNWLQGTDTTTQQTYLGSDWFHRYAFLLDNNMLTHIRNWGPYGGPPVSVPADLRATEQIAMRHYRYTDRHAWLYSAERVQWIRWVMRNREAFNRARRNR
ncbi:hypothetical protein KCU95_g6229, partial [Aureobasidium melanogenum]